MLVYEPSGCWFEYRCCHLNFKYRVCLDFLEIQPTIESRFTLKCLRDIIITYNQIHRTDKYSQPSSIIWPIWLNGWVFVNKWLSVHLLSDCLFDMPFLLFKPTLVSTNQTNTLNNFKVTCLDFWCKDFSNRDFPTRTWL